MAMLSAGTSAVIRSPFCRIAPEGAFCKTEEDSFLLLKSTLRSMEEILRRCLWLPLRRTWIEQPYGEEKITLLEEELIPAIQQCLARIDELDQRLLSEQELLQRSLSCVCRWPEGHRRGGGCGPLLLIFLGLPAIQRASPVKIIRLIPNPQRQIKSHRPPSQPPSYDELTKLALQCRKTHIISGPLL
jgi:hypothetical protein